MQEIVAQKFQAKVGYLLNTKSMYMLLTRVLKMQARMIKKKTVTTRILWKKRRKILLVAIARTVSNDSGTTDLGFRTEEMDGVAMVVPRGILPGLERDAD